MARSRQSKFQENTLLTNQTNLTVNVTTGAGAVAGVELRQHVFDVGLDGGLDELLRRGYSEQDVRKVLGENLLRAFAEVERVARVEQRKISGEGSMRHLEPSKK